MLNDIRRVFRRSMDALFAELEVSEPEDQVAELLSAMRKELVAAKAAIPEYEQAVAGARLAAERERQSVEQCERRQKLAEGIGDTETARIAGEYADRHRQRLAILDQKAHNAQAELEMRQREATEMMVRFKEADANRFGLVAQLRVQKARDRMGDNGDATDPFDDFSRMEERVEGTANYADALDELEDEPLPERPPSVDDRLDELKKRMGRS